jgi:hypothetical protein
MKREPAASAVPRSPRRAFAIAAGVIVALLGLTAYDAVGAYHESRFAAENYNDPVAVRDNLVRYQTWHPTRNLLHPTRDRAEADRLRDLDRRIAGQRDAARERAAGLALTDLEFAECRADLAELVATADGLLRDHGDTRTAGEIQKRRNAYLRRLDERAIEAARDLSAREPGAFHQRCEGYRQYLDHHPTGAFFAEAEAAIDAIASEWDRHDYRGVRDHFRDHAGDVKQLEALGRSYLAAHGRGRFREPVAEMLRWVERAAEPHDYRVVLRAGRFERSVAWLLSRGPDLSVEIEVNGVRYGPSNIVANRYDPVWDYEFPRRVRWKLGDPVRIRVYDHDYYKRLVIDVVSDPNDPVALWMLGGEVLAGNNSLSFESDFRLPEPPPAE